MNSVQKQQAKTLHRGTSFPNVVGAVTALMLLAVGLFPALASVRRSSKNGTCLTNLMQIGYANTIYASQDQADMALPVHRMQFSQCPGSEYCSNPINIGAYEWGGKSGVGRPDNVLFPGSADPLNSKYGTKAGFGPNTRPLNSILYAQTFVDHGGLRPGPGGLEYVRPKDDVGPTLDTTLDLPLNRCPSDTGVTEMHCPDFEQRGLTSYDHFGTSYNANLFMTANTGGGNPLFSNSPYLHRMSDILSPKTTLAYMENNGRFAWTAAPDACSRNGVLALQGIPGATRGWHGKEWTINAAFIDGHAGTIYMRGYKNPDLGRYPSNGSFLGNACIIVRGDGWQIDTLPLPRVPTRLLSGGGVRPSYEDCVSPKLQSRAMPPGSSSSGTACEAGSEPGCAVR